jgi:competence protein ComEC
MNSHRDFWEKYPALSLGISALLGSFLFFETLTLSMTVFWILYQLLLSLKRSCLQIALLLSVFLYTYFLFSTPPPLGPGRAYLSITSVQPYSSPFQQGWIYKGTLRAFSSQALSFPCSALFYGKEEDRPLANSDYLIDGTLKEKSSLDLMLGGAKSWEKVKGSWSLAEIRYQAKKKIRTLLNQEIKEAKVTSFLSALFTGSLDDPLLAFEFGRLGLQHILAISGFHFAILAGFISFLAREILPQRIRPWVLLFMLSLYFLFVGNSPSVQRSFLFASLFLIGQILERRSSGLNLLGACLLIEIALDPRVVSQLSFQLSFLSCFGILLLYAPIQRCLSTLFPLRSLALVQALSPFSQCASLSTSFLSRSISLSLAVNFALLPLLLHHFHRFPALSLLYNLFIPQLSALALFLLLLSLCTYAFFPLFALPLFKVTGFVAGELLELISYPPALLDYGLSSPFSGWLIAPYVACLLLIGIKFIRTDTSLL